MTHLQLSQKAYKAHVTRIFKKVEELMTLDTLDELQMSSLKTALEQLWKKKDVITQLDSQIVEQTTTPEGLEEAILETEDTQDKI